MFNSKTIKYTILFVFTYKSIVPIPVNRFPNELAPKESNNIPKNSLFCSPASVLLAIVKKTPRSFINNENSLRDSAISIILFTSSLFKTIDLTVQDPNSFLQIDATVADAADVNPNGIKTILPNDLSIFPVSL